MKKNVLLILCFLLFVYANSQPTVAPGPASELCPNTNVNLQFSFGANNPSNFSIKNDASLKGCTIIQNINPSGQAIVKFSDKKEAHQFAIYHPQLGVTTYTYTKIKTIDGIKPTWPLPLPSGISPFPYPPATPIYDDVIDLDFPPVLPCGTTTFSYTTPGLRYKDTQGNEYGTTMLLYEWLVPKGWKVNGTVSDGINIIDAGSPTADITPDPISNGELKCRAKNNCDFNLKRSDWYRIFINGRPTLQLFANGSNPLTVVCGDQTIKNFNLENINSYGCVTSFEWTIGSNWLLPNGTPAPATLTTTTPSLDLKPVGNAAPGSVSVKPVINGIVNANQYTCTVIFNTTPPVSINGPSTICSGSAVYSINGIPANSSVVWSVTPANSNIVSLTPNPLDNTVLVNKLTDGLVTLNATITTSCNTTLLANISLILGNPYTAWPYVIGPDPNCMEMGAKILYGATGYPYGANLIWGYVVGGSSGPINYVDDGGINQVGIRILNTNQYNGIYVAVENECGVGIPAIAIFEFQPYCEGDDQEWRTVKDKPLVGLPVITELSISPNPAADQITIRIPDKYLNQQIHIVDQSGKILKKAIAQQSVQTINIANLSSGFYILKIFGKIDQKSIKFIKR